LKQTKKQTYVLDCDGTIADSMPLRFIAWQKVLGEWNCKFDEEQLLCLGAGLNELACIPIMPFDEVYCSGVLLSGVARCQTPHLVEDWQ
jgi:hypothetical protein